MDVLDTYLERYKETPFKWSKFDCTTFIISYIDDMYGTTLLSSSVEGRYSDFRTAVAYALSSGKEWLYVESELPTQTVKIGNLQRGDLVCYSYECWNPMAVMVDDYRVAVVTIKNGLEITPLHNLQGVVKIIRVKE